jgi:signal transduction histidine kinase
LGLTTAAFNTFLENVAEKPATRRPFCAGVLAVACLTDWATGGSPAVFYAIPVAVAAVLEGWAGGLAVAVVSAATAMIVAGQISRATVVESLALVLLACVIAAFAARARRLQADFEGMKRAERLSAIGQLSAGLAHEIRNPLASISGAAAILARRQDLDAKSTKCLEIITSECERLNGLLTNFLNFAGPRPPQLRSVQLEPVLDNVLGLASHGVRGKRVRFEKKIGGAAAGGMRSRAARAGSTQPDDQCDRREPGRRDRHAIGRGGGQ